MERSNSTVIPIVTSTKLPWETPLCRSLDAEEGTQKMANPNETPVSFGPAS